MKYPKTFKQKVNINNINKQFIKLYISKELHSIVPDDDILVDYTYELLIQQDEPDIKEIYNQLLEFLNEDAMKFCKNLWEKLLQKEAEYKERRVLKEGIVKGGHGGHRDHGEDKDEKSIESEHKETEVDKTKEPKSEETKSEGTKTTEHKIQDKTGKIAEPKADHKAELPSKKRTYSTYNASKRHKSQA